MPATPEKGRIHLSFHALFYFPSKITVTVTCLLNFRTLFRERLPRDGGLEPFSERHCLLRDCLSSFLLSLFFFQKSEKKQKCDQNVFFKIPCRQFLARTCKQTGGRALAGRDIELGDSTRAAGVDCEPD